LALLTSARSAIRNATIAVRLLARLLDAATCSAVFLQSRPEKKHPVHARGQGR
jgi:hypothetical protein